MKNLMSLKYFFIISVLSIKLCLAQEATVSKNYFYNPPQDTLKKIFPASDEYKVELRLLPDSVLQKYKNDTDFNYDDKVSETDDWITKIKNWINQQIINLTTSKTYSTILDYLYYALMIIAILLIVRGLVKGDRRGFLFGKTAANEIKPVEYSENIEQINFDELINNYIRNKQYKAAVRYLFLKSLKLLAESGVIEINKNKTNQQYLTEIKNTQMASAFRIATIGFEWIWYGDFQVDEELMKSSQKDFNNLFVLLESR